MEKCTRCGKQLEGFRDYEKIRLQKFTDIPVPILIRGNSARYHDGPDSLPSGVLERLNRGESNVIHEGRIYGEKRGHHPEGKRLYESSRDLTSVVLSTIDLPVIKDVLDKLRTTSNESIIVVEELLSMSGFSSPIEYEGHIIGLEIADVEDGVEKGLNAARIVLTGDLSEKTMHKAEISQDLAEMLYIVEFSETPKSTEEDEPPF